MNCHTTPRGNTKCRKHDPKLTMHCSQTCTRMPLVLICPDHIDDLVEKMIATQDCMSDMRCSLEPTCEAAGHGGGCFSG